jgi:hypothetical protein
MHRARSEDDIPTLPAFPVPGLPEATPYFPEPPPRPRRELVIDTAAEGFFAVGVAMNDVVPTDEELASWWAAQRRRELSRYVVAAVVVCFVIMAATAAQLG